MDFKITQGKGFMITFPNGVTASVQFGPYNYCDPHYNNDRYPLIGRPDPQKNDLWEAQTAEVAAWIASSENGFSRNWVTKKIRDDGDHVIGYLTASDVLWFLNEAAKLKID